MQIAISSRNTAVTPRLEEVIRDKIGRLDRFVEGMDSAKVHFSEEKNPRLADRKEVCEVEMHGHGHHIRCKVAAPDPFTAIDLAVEKLEHQLHKLKTKLVRRNHGGAKAGARTGNGNGLGAVLRTDRVTTVLTDEELDLKIVKTKRFAMTPMTATDAAIQMELLGHDFYFFANIETGLTGVVYRRSDGSFGLIDEEPREA
jgi:putative sigma-54 modulation protein